MPTKDKGFCINHRWDVFIGTGYDIEATCSLCAHGVFELWAEEIAAVLQLAQELAPERLAVILDSCKAPTSNV